MNKPTSISQRILQAHCQSRTSQRYNQSFVKELANPTHNRLTNRTKEEHRTDNSGFAKKRVQWLIEHSASHQLLWYVDSLVLRNPLLRKAAKRYTVFNEPKMEKSYVYFALKGDNFNPDHITNKLGILPTKIYRKGDSIGNNGNKIKFSAWYLYTDKIDNIFVNLLVEDLITKLYDKIDIIKNLKNEYQLTSILEIVLYIDENENSSTPVIGQDLRTIEFLYKTSTETDVDIYKFNSTL